MLAEIFIYLTSTVILAKAGISLKTSISKKIPAYAGMTTLSEPQAPKNIPKQ